MDRAAVPSGHGSLRERLRLALAALVLQSELSKIAPGRLHITWLVLG